MKPKLITYDIDGTLVPEYGDCVPAENREAILRAKRAGCMICPSSGRTHSNLRKLLGDLVEDTCSVTMNGGAIYGPHDEPLHFRFIENDLAEELFARQKEVGGNCPVIFCRDSMYLHASDAAAAQRLMEIHKGSVRLISSLRDVTEPIIKISSFCPDASALYPALAEGFSDPVRTAVAGREWVDYTVSDKGTGLADLCEITGISPAETAAIGDNFNDEPMLDFAAMPVLMDTADPLLLQKFPLHCSTFAEAIDRILSQPE